MQNTFKKNKNIIFLIAVLIFIPAIFFSTSQSMIKIWINDNSFNHGFFILPIAIWILYEMKNQLNSLPISPEPRTFILLIIVIIGWLMATIVGIQLLQQLCLIFIILGSVWIVFGRKFLVTAAFPLGFLFFSVPMGESLIAPMMEFTAGFTINAVRLIGIPIYRDGLLFSLPSGNWSVIEACSGVRYLITSFTLGTLYAYLTYRSNIKRITFVAIALIVSVIANGLRALGIVLIGHHTDMEYGTGGDHTFYGWIFYGFVIILLFYIGSNWQDERKPIKLTKVSLATKLPLGLISLITITLVSSQLLSGIIIDESNKNHKEVVNIIIPDNFSGWQAQKNRQLSWKPKLTKPELKVVKNYQYGQNLVQLVIGYYGTQTQGSEAVTFQNKLIEETSLWEKNQAVELKVGNLYVTETELYQFGKKVLVWNWYLIGKYETPNTIIAKLLNLINVVIYQRNDASFITLATPVIDNRSESRKQLKYFLNDAKKDIVSPLIEAIYKKN